VRRKSVISRGRIYQLSRASVVVFAGAVEIDFDMQHEVREPSSPRADSNPPHLGLVIFPAVGIDDREIGLKSSAH
jgi:hypothetical protein